MSKRKEIKEKHSSWDRETYLQRKQEMIETLTALDDANDTAIYLCVFPGGDEQGIQQGYIPDAYMASMLYACITEHPEITNILMRAMLGGDFND